MTVVVGILLALVASVSGAVSSSAVDLVATTTTLKLNPDGTGTVTVTVADGSNPTDPVDLWVGNTWQRAYTLNNGTAAVELGTQSLGDHKITVRYRASGTLAASGVSVMWTAPGTVQANTTTALNLNPDGTGTVTVTVADGATPTNLVDLWIDNTWQRAYTLTNGKAAVDLGKQSLGDHKVTVRYRESSTAAASGVTVTWTAPGTVQATTTTTLALNPDGTGTVTVTVADGSSPTNLVDLWIGSTWQRAYTLTNGTAAIDLGKQPVGEHKITVRYRDSSSAAASGVTVMWTAPGTNQLATTTALELNADGTGKVSVTVADGSNPINPVDLWIDGTWQRAYTLTNGTAAINLGKQAYGDHKIAVRYRPSSTAAASSTAVMWTAPGTVQAATAILLEVNADGTGKVSVTVADGSNPTNPVDLWIDGTWQRAYTLTNGTAAINLGKQALGDHKIAVRYRPSSINAASNASLMWTAPGTVQVPTTTTLDLKADGTGTVAVAVADGSAPANQVDLWIDGTWQRAYTLTNGSAAFDLGKQSLGDHKITFRYRPSSTAGASSVSVMWTAPGTVQVPTTTALELNANNTGKVTVTLADGSNPTNPVDLWIDGTWQRAYTLTNGTAAVDLGSLPGGDHRVTARYRPSSTAAASSVSLPWSVVTADQGPTSVTVAVLPDGTGTITAQAAGSATNPVDMWVGGQYKGVFHLTNGKAAFALGSRDGGELQVSVRYRPSPTQLESTAQTVWSVNTAPTPAPEACGETILKESGEAWTCTFADDFDGTTLDSRKWRVQTGDHTGGAVKACNVESPETVSVHDGALHLSVVKGEPVTCTGLDGAMTPYRSGRVTTFNAWSQQYGRFEARIMTTATTEAGLHEAFWMWPDTRYPEGQGEWPANGEIDIMETRSILPDRAVPFLHSADDLLGSITSGVNANTAWNCAAERGVWNTYTLEWAPDRIEIKVNGATCLVNTAPNEAFAKRYILILSQALGAHGNSLIEGTKVPATMTVDYVRAWS